MMPRLLPVMTNENTLTDFNEISINLRIQRGGGDRESECECDHNHPNPLLHSHCCDITAKSITLSLRIMGFLSLECCVVPHSSFGTPK